MIYIELNARNIVNINDIDVFLKNKIKNIEQVEIKKWILANLKTYIKNDYESVSKVTKFKSTDPDWLKKGVEEGTALEVDLKDRIFIKQLNHILDYFKSLSEKELLEIKSISFKDAVDKSDEWTIELSKKASLIPDEGGESIVRKYSNGVTWKRLLTQQSLEREGSYKRMKHCVGGKVHVEKLLNNKAIYYSLRDKNDHPHCTIEVEKNRVEQIKGFDNGIVKKEFIKYCKNFLEKPFFKHYSSVNPDDKPNIGIIEINGKDYDIYNLPENLTTPKGLNLSNFGITYLPDNLTVNGNLNLFESKIKYLPNNLTVKGNLNLISTKITSLPENLIVDGKLSLNLTKITSLPKNLKDIGGIDLKGTKITSLPDNLTVNGVLDLTGTDIISLPENLTVKDNLYLSDTKITFLPESLKVSGSLLFLQSKIKSLPNNIKKYKDLKLKESHIEYLPDNLVIEGDLDLDRSKIKYLPKNLTVTKDLCLNKTKITSLPNDLTVDGSIHLDESKITFLPDKLIVRKNLNLRYSSIKKLPEYLIVNGNLNINNTNIKFLPNYISVEKSIDIRHTKIKTIPETISVGRDIIASQDMKPLENSEYFSIIYVKNDADEY